MPGLFQPFGVNLTFPSLCRIRFYFSLLRVIHPQLTLSRSLRCTFKTLISYRSHINSPLPRHLRTAMHRSDASCIFLWMSPLWRARVSDAVELTSDIALQLKPVLFTERLRFDLSKSVEMSFHEELQSFTSMYGGNGDSWYGVTVVRLFKTIIITDVKMSQIISEKN